MWTIEFYYMFRIIELCEILVNHCDSNLMNIELCATIESK